MKLNLDSSQNIKTKVCVDNACVEEHYQNPSHQKILEVIDEVVGKNKENIDNIQINKGPGSFTSLRAGIAIANTIAWALKIKINGKKLEFPDYTYIK